MINGGNVYAKTDSLIGKKITAVRMNEEFLAFLFDDGYIQYGVEGDCCSHSFFHDFIGIDKLLNNGPIISITAIPIDLITQDEIGSYQDDCIQQYGYSIVTEHPTWGEQTSVFSFRNASNGYYGGYLVDSGRSLVDLPDLTTDVLEAASV